MKLSKNTLILIGLMQTAAFWPVWEWFYKSFNDPSGNAWGIIPLMTAGVFLISRKQPDSVNIRLLYVPVVLCLVYTVSFHISPPSIRAAIAVFTLSLTASILAFNKPIHIGLSGLLMLSLPVMPSLQFYFGYPMRVTSGMLAVPLLQFSGFPVQLEGTLLNMNNILISIDAPCSGIKMMWAGLYLAMTLSCFYRLSVLKTIGILLLTFPVIIFGNTIRTTGLFFTESGIIQLPSWSHNAIGMMAFLLISITILVIAERFKKEAPCKVSTSS